MPNPLLEMHQTAGAGYGSPLQDGAGSTVRDLTDFGDKSELGVAGLILAAAGFIFLLKFAGFRAMIAVGRD